MAFDAQVSAVILGNLNTREYVLVDTTPGPIPASLHGRGFEFIGIMGIVQGVPHTALAVELDAASSTAIAQAWTQYLVGLIVAKLQPAQPAQSTQTDDSAAWCESLYALSDTRD